MTINLVRPCKNVIFKHFSTKKEEVLITKQKKTTPNRGSFHIELITINLPTFKRMLAQKAVVITFVIGYLYS